jgi:hypothetical protein
MAHDEIMVGISVRTTHLAGMMAKAITQKEFPQNGGLAGKDRTEEDSLVEVK